MRPRIEWQKSSFSGNQGPNCVEVARDADAVLLRESDEPRAVLALTPARLGAFVSGVKAGSLDHLMG
ncbi:DUF397 domain-containing protein [Streptomyces sp. H27-D2]|uniref:DUF397 domain-containing protein n=1 Tax=Streptomyces sp. H27-D2 TaxID=3046304 RepID=UPI002DB57133|nr:DUF397 domain-containing protein [Streptomyces sp. H27-D2]MEC4018099.1 DUF397 domain-containing protein [Streptomyces sp. H27-D2]